MDDGNQPSGTKFQIENLTKQNSKDENCQKNCCNSLRKRCFYVEHCISSVLTG